MSEREKILRKIAKLEDMARGGSAHEAQIAAERIREFMEKLPSAEAPEGQAPGQVRYRLRLHDATTWEIVQAPPEVVSRYQAIAWARVLIREWAGRPAPRRAVLMVEKDGTGVWQAVDL